MSDHDESFLGSFLIGAGISAMIMAPFYIGYRYGVHVLAFIVATFSTLFAIFSPTILEMASEITEYGPKYGAQAAEIILQMDKIGWWWIAIGMWINFILLYIAPILFTKETVSE